MTAIAGTVSKFQYHHRNRHRIPINVIQHDYALEGYSIEIN